MTDISMKLISMAAQNGSPAVPNTGIFFENHEISESEMFR